MVMAIPERMILSISILIRSPALPLPTCLNAVLLTCWLEGQVDQLEDRYLGMVEASGSNPDLSIKQKSANLFYPKSSSLFPREF